MNKKEKKGSPYLKVGLLLIIQQLLVVNDSNLDKLLNSFLLLDLGIASLATLEDQGTERRGRDNKHRQGNQSSDQEGGPVERAEPVIDRLHDLVQVSSLATVAAKGERGVAAEGTVGHDLDDLLGGVSLGDLVTVDLDNRLLEGDTTDDRTILGSDKLGRGGDLDGDKASVKGLHEIVHGSLGIEGRANNDAGFDSDGDCDGLLGLSRLQWQWDLVQEDLLDHCNCQIELIHHSLDTR